MTNTQEILQASTQEVSITRALGTLKMMDKRINDLTLKTEVLHHTYASPQTTSVISYNEEFNKRVKSGYQSLIALIKIRNQVKASIIASNATTIVSINGVEMTVAGAIERKNSIKYEVNLLKHLKEQYTTKKFELQRHQTTYLTRLDNFINSQAESVGKTKQDTEWVKEATRSYSIIDILPSVNGEDS